MMREKCGKIWEKDFYKINVNERENKILDLEQILDLIQHKFSTIFWVKFRAFWLGMQLYYITSNNYRVMQNS